MQIEVFENPQELAEHTAKFILNLVRDKPTATLILTSGDTPVKTYKKIVQLAQPGDFDQVTVIGLDEWVGVPATSEGSCRYIVEENLLKPLNVNPAQYTFFDSMTADLQSECERVDNLIFEKGGVDFILVGVGLNGHIGLNEPGVSFDLYSHVSKLAEITISTGQKYFNQSTELTQGITIGLKHLLEANMAVLIANGEKKAEILREIVLQDPNIQLPATVFKKHRNGHLWIDKAAADLLQ